MYAVLSSGSTLTTSGVYRVSHSTGHHPDTNISMLRGFTLPFCGTTGCKASFALLQPGHSFFRDKAETASARNV
jgi:hypothetical protein